MTLKYRFDEVNEEKKELKNQLDERDAQLKELKAKASGNDELTAKITELEKLNETTKEEYEAKMNALCKETAIKLSLKDQKAKNIKAVKALLDIEKFALDGDKLRGLEEQLESLNESDSYLFGEDTLSGRTPSRDTDLVSPEFKKNSWSKEDFNLTEQGKILRENPELATKLRAAAK